MRRFTVKASGKYSGESVWFVIDTQDDVIADTAESRSEALAVAAECNEWAARLVRRNAALS